MLGELWRYVPGALIVLTAEILVFTVLLKLVVLGTINRLFALGLAALFMLIFVPLGYIIDRVFGRD